MPPSPIVQGVRLRTYESVRVLRRCCHQEHEQDHDQHHPPYHFFTCRTHAFDDGVRYQTLDRDPSGCLLNRFSVTYLTHLVRLC